MKTRMGPPGLINLLIYAVCSVFVTTHTTPVPVHSLERPPTNIVHGNQHACSLPMQDQQESMQFIPLNHEKVKQRKEATTQVYNYDY